METSSETEVITQPQDELKSEEAVQVSGSTSSPTPECQPKDIHQVDQLGSDQVGSTSSRKIHTIDRIFLGFVLGIVDLCWKIDKLVNAKIRNAQDSHKPVFIIGISLVQLLIHVWVCYQNNGTLLSMGGVDTPESHLSHLACCLSRKDQSWNFLSYMLVHTGWEHLLGNLISQFGIGIPLELAMGPARTGLIYFAGVLGGSLIPISIFAFLPEFCFVGASAGINALFAAHLARVCVNTYKRVQLIGVVMFGMVVLTIAGMRTLDQYGTSFLPITWLMDNAGDVTPSKVGHFTGACSGFIMGLIVMNRSRLSWRSCFYAIWACAGYLYFFLKYWTISIDCHEYFRLYWEGDDTRMTQCLKTVDLIRIELEISLNQTMCFI